MSEIFLATGGVGGGGRRYKSVPKKNFSEEIRTDFEVVGDNPKTMN